MQYFFHVLSIHYIGILSKNLCTCTFLRKVIIYKYSLMSSTIICMRVNVMYVQLEKACNISIVKMRVFLVVVDYRKIKPNTQKPVNYFYTIIILSISIRCRYECTFWVYNVSLYFWESLLKSSTLSIKGTILSTDTYLLFKNFCFRILIYQNIVYLLIWNNYLKQLHCI